MASSLTSSSTDEEVRDAYDDNASYAEDNDSAKAAVFQTACMILLRREPMQGSRNGTAWQLDKQSVREELKRVRQWLSARSSSTGASRSRHFSFEGFRS